MLDFPGKDRNLDARSSGSTSVLKTTQNNSENIDLFPKLAEVLWDACVSTSVLGAVGIQMIKLCYVCYVSYFLMIVPTPVKRRSNPGWGWGMKPSSWILPLSSLPLKFRKNGVCITPAVSTSSFYSNLSFIFYHCTENSTIQSLHHCPLRKYYIFLHFQNTKQNHSFHALKLQRKLKTHIYKIGNCAAIEVREPRFYKI